MDEGNKLYREFNICHDQITLDKVPEKISLYGNVFQNQTTDEYYSLISPNGMKTTLTSFTTDGTNKVAIIILGKQGQNTSSGYASTLFYWKETFHIFDPHGRNHTGMPSTEPAALLTFDSMEKCATYLFVLGKQLDSEQFSLSTLSVQYARRDVAKDREYDKLKKRRSREIQKTTVQMDEKNQKEAEHKQKCRKIHNEMKKNNSSQEDEKERKRKSAEYKKKYREYQKIAEKENSSQEDDTEKKKKASEYKKKIQRKSEACTE